MSVAPTAARATMSVREVARYLGLSPNSTYRAIERGEIPSLRIGKRIVVPRRWLAELLEGESGRAEAPHERREPPSEAAPTSY